MKCVFCWSPDSKVIDSRSAEDGSVIRRRRECLNCGKRFTTYEKVESMPLVVVKKDKSRQSFNRDKLMGGLMRACEKRPVSLDQLEKVIDDVESMIQNSMQREVSSQDIGDMVLEKLKEIDQVAYVRFASVYKQFDDIESFMDELNKLKKEQ